MRGELAAMIRQISGTAKQVSGSSQAMSAASEQTSAAIEQIAQATNGVASGAEEQTSMVHNVRGVTAEAVDLSAHAREAAGRTRESFDGLGSSVESVSVYITKINDAVEQVEHVANDTGAATEEVSASAQEIIRYTPPRLVASSDSWVRGVLNLRGRILPLYDLASRLAVSSEVRELSKIVIIQTGSDTTGVIVDEVDEVFTVDDEQFEPAPGADTTLIEAIAKVGERLIVLLAPAGIFGVELAAA